MSRTHPVADYLGSVRADVTVIADLLSTRGDLSHASVPSCPDWSVRRLVTHLGGVHRMVTTAITSGRPGHSGDHAPDDNLSAGGLADWLREGAEQMCRALARDPGAPAWSFDPEGGTVGWWRRRQTMETLVHRVDVEQAADVPPLIDPGVAADGISEVLEVMVRLRQGQGDLTLPAHSVVLRAEPEEREWILGKGPVEGRAVGSAADLFLVLWHRLPASTLTTDQAAAAMLALSLVPCPLSPDPPAASTRTEQWVTTTPTAGATPASPDSCHLVGEELRFACLRMAPAATAASAATAAEAAG